MIGKSTVSALPGDINIRLESYLQKDKMLLEN
jgi:hypothetical protein